MLEIHHQGCIDVLWTLAKPTISPMIYQSLQFSMCLSRNLWLASTASTGINKIFSEGQKNTLLFQIQSGFYENLANFDLDQAENFGKKCLNG